MLLCDTQIEKNNVKKIKPLRNSQKGYDKGMARIGQNKTERSPFSILSLV